MYKRYITYRMRINMEYIQSTTNFLERRCIPIRNSCKDNEGQHKILDNLYRKNHSFLSLFLQRNGITKNDADDIIQDVFTRLSKSKSIENCAQHPRAYLLKATMNSVKDNYRRQTVRRLNSHDKIENLEITSHEPSAEDHLIWKQNLAIVYLAISQLSPKCREIFEMHRFSNYSYKEIGKKTGLSHRTVENYINEALKYCRKSLLKNE